MPQNTNMARHHIKMLVVTYEGCGVSEVEAVYPEHGDGRPHGARHQQHRQGDRRVGPPARRGLRGYNV